MREAGVLALIMWAIVSADACGRRRRGPPPDRTKPILYCPVVPPMKADKLQEHALVTWKEPVIARDNRDGDIVASRNGKPPGSVFFGDTTVRYSAKDRSGNYASCTFTISVSVTTCPSWGPMPDGWMKCHTSDKMRRGSVCRFGCYQGHYLDPPASDRTTCEDHGEWSIPAQPQCIKVKCPVETPESTTVAISCSDDYNYRSICTYSCSTGYDVLPGFSRVRVCSATGNWRGNVPQCVDTSPPEFLTCPHIKTAYAERSKTSGRVWWDEPEVADNSGHVTPIQSLGPASGAELNVGEYDVTYMAYDGVNNSVKCEFKVVVRQISCHAIYPLPYTSVLCPDGRRYGSYCNFSCDTGTAITGHSLAECDRTGDLVPYGQWSFADYQPYCKLMSLCPAKRAPANGALPCDTWLRGKFCQTMCSEGYIFNTQEGMEFMKQLLICGDSGEWSPGGDIPDCVQATDIELMFFKLDARYYYEGNCEDVTSVIGQKFIDIFSATPGLCEPPACSVANVEVLCGDVSGRRKRDSSGGDIMVSITLNVKRQEGDMAMQAMKQQQMLTTVVQDGIAAHEFDIDTGNSTLSPGAIDISQADFECQPGYEKNMRSFKCAECTAGHYFEVTSGSCTKCPRGQFQPEALHSSCHHCPETETTEREGATSSDHCVAACRAGQFSSTGAQPCSPCDIATYADGYGTLSCTACPGTQITTTEGTTSRDGCHSFDIDADAASATLAVDTGSDVTELHISLWVRCTECAELLNITGTNGSNVVSVGGTSLLAAQLLGVAHDTDTVLASGTLWHNIHVTIRKRGCEVKVDGMTILSDNCAYEDTLIGSNITVAIGGDTFRGYVSELNIWTEDSPDVGESTASCNSDHIGGGDLLSWRRFAGVISDFLVTRSKCDDFDNCQSNPCRHNGDCSDAIDNFNCECPAGYTGTTCNVNINDCIDAPCENGGRCVDGVDQFTCDCPHGYTGRLCETKVVDGVWIEWEQWSGCSVTCGQGHVSRVRVCEVPVNGGRDCEGVGNETTICIEDDCINECARDPTTLENGLLNCEWNDTANETRTCSPNCDEGFDFDSDLFLDQITCGPETGYTWNVNNADNPNSQLPECKEMKAAIKNTINCTGTYLDLVAGTASTQDADVDELIINVVDDKVSTIDNIKTGKVLHTHTYILDKPNDVTEDARLRRATDLVSLAVEFTCTPTGIDACNDLLTTVATTMSEFVTSRELSIQINTTVYNVDENSTYVDGVAECAEGTVPVLHYCIPCGTGTYQDDFVCERCARGTYQDTSGQTTCQPCPRGWTTQGLQTRDVSMCNVADATHTSDDNVLVIVLSSIGGVTFITLAIILTMWLCKSKQGKAAGSVADIGNLSRMATMTSHQHFTTSNKFTSGPVTVYATRFHSDEYQQKRLKPDLADAELDRDNISTRTIHVSPYTPPPGSADVM